MDHHGQVFLLYRSTRRASQPAAAGQHPPRGRHGPPMPTAIIHCCGPPVDRHNIPLVGRSRTVMARLGKVSFRPSTCRPSGVTRGSRAVPPTGGHTPTVGRNLTPSFGVVGTSWDVIYFAGHVFVAFVVCIDQRTNDNQKHEAQETLGVVSFWYE